MDNCVSFLLYQIDNYLVCRLCSKPVSVGSKILASELSLASTSFEAGGILIPSHEFSAGGVEVPSSKFVVEVATPFFSFAGSLRV